jgi:hypothetical protein
MQDTSSNSARADGRFQHEFRRGLAVGPSAILFDKQPFERVVRWRTVANALSIGFVVRVQRGSRRRQAACRDPQ